ncbi:hypothetical protein SAY87_002491 [Trapa incisa]|uniref:Uncharacterized protein n=1 Tax=Trapa incisa TaxID=236973 RepID=A0AAN7JVY9_9MYRT|nr:hypothetical protein SAY87_002491 [Trapa incisa]
MVVQFSVRERVEARTPGEPSQAGYERRAYIYSQMRVKGLKENPLTFGLRRLLRLLHVPDNSDHRHSSPSVIARCPSKPTQSPTLKARPSTPVRPPPLFRCCPRPTALTIR